MIRVTSKERKTNSTESAPPWTNKLYVQILRCILFKHSFSLGDNIMWDVKHEDPIPSPHELCPLNFHKGFVPRRNVKSTIDLGYMSTYLEREYGFRRPFFETCIARRSFSSPFTSVDITIRMD
jgi:hypothetical protein